MAGRGTNNSNVVHVILVFGPRGDMRGWRRRHALLGKVLQSHDLVKTLLVLIGFHLEMGTTSRCCLFLAHEVLKAVTSVKACIAVSWLQSSQQSCVENKQLTNET